METKRETKESILLPDTRPDLSEPSSDPKYIRLMKNYDKQVQSFWSSQKFKWTDDKKYFPNLPPLVQRSIIKSFGFFLTADDLVGEFVEKFLAMIKRREFRRVFLFQGMMEGQHAETYTDGFKAFVPNSADRERVKKEVVQSGSVKKMTDFIVECLNNDSVKPAVKAAMLGFIEGVMFSPLFAFIDWLKYQGYNLPDLTASNIEISRDEFAHQQVDAFINLCLDEKITRDEILTLINKGLPIVHEFIDDLIPEEGFPELSRVNMKLHIDHCVNIFSSMFLIPNPLGQTKSPFTWMASRGQFTKTNFFETTATNYVTATTGDGGSEAVYVGGVDY